MPDSSLFSTCSVSYLRVNYHHCSRFTLQVVSPVIYRQPFRSSTLSSFDPSTTFSTSSHLFFYLTMASSCVLDRLSMTSLQSSYCVHCQQAFQYRRTSRTELISNTFLDVITFYYPPVAFSTSTGRHFVVSQHSPRYHYIVLCVEHRRYYFYCKCSLFGKFTPSFLVSIIATHVCCDKVRRAILAWSLIVSTKNFPWKTSSSLIHHFIIDTKASSNMADLLFEVTPPRPSTELAQCSTNNYIRHPTMFKHLREKSGLDFSKDEQAMLESIPIRASNIHDPFYVASTEPVNEKGKLLVKLPCNDKYPIGEVIKTYKVCSVESAVMYIRVCRLIVIRRRKK